MTKAIRCSSLPLAHLCPGSVHSDEGVLVDPWCDAAGEGTDVHGALAPAPDGSLAPERLAALSDDSRICYFLGSKMWREHIAAWMPNSSAEVTIDDEEHPGHIDRLAFISDEEAVVLDWKSGRKDHEYKHQGFGYARGLFRRYPSLRKITVHFAWIRDQELESYTVICERAEEWRRNVEATILNWDGVYHPGEHCQGCKRCATCPALRQMARRSVEIVTGESLDLATMDGPQLVEFHERAAMLEKLVKDARAALRLEVLARGDVPDGKGGVLHVVEENGPREIDALKAWPVLQSRLTDEELSGCVKIRISEMEKVIGANAGRGKGAEAKRALAAELEAVGAVTQGKVEKLKHERKA